MKFPFCLLVLALVFASAQAAQKNARQIEADDAKASAQMKPVGTAQVYKTVGDRELHVYILNPADWKASDRRPAVVWFHGGAWEINKGGPTAFNAQSEYFVTRGLVNIQVEYRLIKDSRKEAPIEASMDAKSAMRWVRAHASELGIDPKRIASGGGSAGGQLAAFVGMVPGTEDPQDDLKISCRPAAMLLYNPALLEDHAAAPPAEGEGKADRTGFSDELAKKYRPISPFLNVSSDDPPGIIVVGDQDSVLPQPQLKRFLALCKTAGVRMDSVVYPGEGHAFFGIARSLDRFYDTTIEMDKFMGSLGWVQGPPTLTKEWVNTLAEGTPHPPNKLGREKMKKKDQ